MASSVQFTQSFSCAGSRTRQSRSECYVLVFMSFRQRNIQRNEMSATKCRLTKYGLKNASVKNTNKEILQRKVSEMYGKHELQWSGKNVLLQHYYPPNCAFRNGVVIPRVPTRPIVFLN